MLRTANLLVLTLAAGTAVAADDFARLAPPDAALLVCVGNYAQTKGRLLATPLGRLTEQRQFADLIEEARKSQMEQFETLAAELGVDVEEWPEPEGMVGLATVMAPIEDAEEWGPSREPTFLVAADFGERIAQIQEIVDALVDKGLDQGLIEISTQDVGGVEVLTLTPLAGADEEEEWDGGGAAGALGLRSLLSGDKPTTVAISGSMLLVSDREGMVVDALDRERGADVASAADEDVIAAALAQHPDGTTDYVVMRPAEMGLAEAFFGGMGIYPGSGVDTGQILADLGIANIKALSLGLQLDSPDAQAEFTLGVLDTERSGLVSLLDMTGQAWDPPAFTSPDAASATRLLVDFAALPEVVRSFWATLPGELQDEQAATFETVMGFVDAIAPTLGPEVHMVQTIGRPYGAESAGAVYVIPTSNPIPINNLLVLGVQAGLKSREFAGGTIYDLQGLLPVPLSVSVSYGSVFVGLTASVENALRLMSASGSDLSDDPAFQDALRPLPSTGNAMQFTRTMDILGYSIWSAQHTRELMIEQYRASGVPEEYIDQLREMEDPTPEWLKNLDVEALGRGVGDISMEIAPARDGFRGRLLVHEPR